MPYPGEQGGNLGFEQQYQHTSDTEKWTEGNWNIPGLMGCGDIENA